MNFLPMQYYLEVVKEKSISHAAARFHITQQTLSAHIAALEKELGCTLFRRKPDFALTYAGHVFYEYARRFDSLYRSMRQEFDDISGNEAGELSTATETVDHTDYDVNIIFTNQYIFTPYVLPNSGFKDVRPVLILAGAGIILFAIMFAASRNHKRKKAS